MRPSSSLRAAILMSAVALSASGAAESMRRVSGSLTHRDPDDAPKPLKPDRSRSKMSAEQREIADWNAAVDAKKAAKKAQRGLGLPDLLLLLAVGLLIVSIFMPALPICR